MKIIHLIASRIAMFEIERVPENLKDVILQLLETMQADDRVNIRINSEDLKFLEELRKRSKNEDSQLQNVKFVTIALALYHNVVFTVQNSTVPNIALNIIHRF